jgi:hypothetical protein
MDIIREFHAERTVFSELVNIKPHKIRLLGSAPTTRFFVGDQLAEAEILLPAVYPQLVTNYTGLEIDEPQGITIAALSPPQTYRYFASEKWLDSQAPVYQSPDVIRAGMPFWEGALQLRLRLDRGASFESIRLGYIVPEELTNYLVEFALPLVLNKIPVQFTRQTYTDSTGMVYLPDGFDFDAIAQVLVQLPGKVPIPAMLSPTRGITPGAGNPLPPDAPLQLVFSSTVNTGKRGSDEQIEYLPTIFLDPGDFTSWRLPNQEAYASIDETTVFVDSPTSGFNLPVSVSITAELEKDATAIALALTDYISKHGRLYAPAFDLEFGMQVVGGGIKKGVSPLLEGGLPTKRFQILIRNICT